jgi:hypothetical protein
LLTPDRAISLNPFYSGSPAKSLPVFAAMTRRKLSENRRCLYLNSPPMVAGMRSYLAAEGVDVAQEVAKAGLVLSSEQGHLVDGRLGRAGARCAN